MSNIIRVLPKYKSIIHKSLKYDECYRYSNIEFNEFEKLKKDNNFKKWFSGINPLTNRKCKIHKKVHINTGRKFNYESWYYYDRMEKIQDIESYLKENELLNNKFELDMKTIKKYNKKIDELRKQIKNLKWNDYIIFEEKKYGIPPILNYIHKENDCNGEIKQYDYETCRCHLCEDWNGCSDGGGTRYMRCNKCDYNYEKRESSSGRNYKGK